MSTKKQSQLIARDPKAKSLKKLSSHEKALSHRTKFPIEVMVGYRRKGLTCDEIARLMGCSASLVSERLNEIEAKLNAVKVYREVESDILALKELELLSGITPEKVEDANARDLAMAAAMLYDRRRLSEGKSTANIAYADMVQQLREIERELRELGDGQTA